MEGTLPTYEYRCPCGKLLFKGVLFDAHVEIKCKGCNKMITIDGAQNTSQNQHLPPDVDSA